MEEILADPASIALAGVGISTVLFYIYSLPAVTPTVDAFIASLKNGKADNNNNKPRAVKALDADLLPSVLEPAGDRKSRAARAASTAPTPAKAAAAEPAPASAKKPAARAASKGRK